MWSLQLSGRQPWPPPLQTGISTKILKISKEWQRNLVDEFFLYLFAEFDLRRIWASSLQQFPRKSMLKSQIQRSQYDQCKTQRPKEFKECRSFQIYQSVLGFLWRIWTVGKPRQAAPVWSGGGRSWRPLRCKPCLPFLSSPSPAKSNFAIRCFRLPKKVKKHHTWVD